MKLSGIYIRDPFILSYEDEYYMYSSIRDRKKPGFQVYISKDMIEWGPPVPVFLQPPGFWSDRDYWAPEVHAYDGAFYLFASFKSHDRCRGTQILRAQTPVGPFHPICDGPVTPVEWECLDGTLYVDKNKEPWIIFCHEWIQIKDGTICAMKLKKDLAGPAGDPVILFHASEAQWVRPFDGNYITDGPFIIETSSRTLLMLWSSTCDSGYCLACAKSPGGMITGPWIQETLPLFSEDGGHGMFFYIKGRQGSVALHAPNDFRGNERAMIIPAELTEDSIHLVRNDR